MIFPAFLAKWLNPPGQRVDFDHVYAYQCVDPIRDYLYECFGLGAGVSGNAIDYWDKPTALLLTKFQKVPTQDVRQGDITVLLSPVTSLGHIGIATGNVTATTFEMMEQNGSTGNGTGTGPDAIRTRFIAKNRIVGVLRPIPVVVAPTVPMITLDQLIELYHDILQRDPDAGGVQHYVGRHTYDFVRQDMLNSGEYKNLQASQAAAAAAAQAAADAAAKAAEAAGQQTIPVATGASSPAGAMTVPTSTTKYPIKTTLKTYGSLTDAVNRTNPKGELLTGASWYEYCEKSGMINITQTPGVSIGTWINPADNVVPVAAPAAPVTRTDTTPEPSAPAKPVVPVETAATIIHSFIPLMPDGSPVECKLLTNAMAIDALGNYNPIDVVMGQYVKVYGTHIAGGHTYATVHSSDAAKKDNQMYGILVTARDNFAPYLNDPYTLGERLQVNWEVIYDKVAKTIDGVFRALKRKK